MMSLSHPSPRRALTSLSLSLLLSSLGISIANVALPTLGTAFDASFAEVQWVVLAYLLATTSLIVSAGRLGDLLGSRRLLLGGIATFTLASAACALAPTLALLVAARAVQGLGAAILMALSLALVGESVPKEKTGSAMGLLGTMSAAGTALGPSLGGLLIATLGWRAIFFVNVPIGIVTFVLAWRSLPADRPRPSAERAPFDTRGTLLLALTLAAYAMAMTTGRGSVGLAAIAGASLFVLAERNAESPLVRMAMLRDRVRGAGLAMSALVTTVVMATLVVGPFHLSGTLALDAARAGLVMTCGPIVAALTGVPAGRLVDRFGTRAVMIGGLLAMAAGASMLAIVPARYGIPGYVTPLIAITAGYALFQAANNTAVMSELAAEQRGVVSGMLNLSRNLGLITGASLMGAVFAFGGMRMTFALAAAMMLVALATASASRSGDGSRSRPSSRPSHTTA